jgi:hypothetical protein
MKKRILQLSAVAALVAVSVSGVAATVTVNAAVGSALTATTGTAANFGTTILSGPGVGTVVSLSATGNTISATNSAIVSSGTSGSMTITGTGSAAVGISWPGNPVTTGVAFAGTNNPTSCTLSTGTCTVGYGGDLTIAANISPGVKNGTATVDLIYS